MHIEGHRISEYLWQSELEKTKRRYHAIVCWVAIVLNPIWSLADFYNSNENWIGFFWFRICVALCTLLGYLFRKKIGTTAMALIPFLGISLQNAYMYSVMNEAELQKHTLAYVALFIGAGMLVMWRPIYSFSVVGISLLANILFFKMFSDLGLEQVLSNGGLLTLTVAVFTILLIHTRYNLTKKEIIARLALDESKRLLEIKNKEITDSIVYAQGIQEAMLPSYDEIKKTIPDSFVLFMPKDIVSGDFFWFNALENDFLLAAADCTGHGVPGALMSMIGATALDEIVREKKIRTPNEILNKLREKIIETLGKKESSSKDGMDISLVRVQSISNENILLSYSGAFNSLWILRNKTLEEIKGDKFPVGKFVGDLTEPFHMHQRKLEKGDRIYLFTDGYPDQFGGPKEKKFKYRPFENLLLSIEKKSMSEQREILLNVFLEWKGNQDQTDDVLVIGIKI